MAAPAEQAQFSLSLAQFSTSMYQNLAKRSEGNLFYSPYSISVALALASQGAKGATFEEIRDGLHLSGDQAAVADQFSTSQTALRANVGAATLNVANKVYVKEGWTLNPTFEAVAVNKFDSEAEAINFVENAPAAAKINGWVGEKTNNKIKDLIKADSLDQDTRLVLVNAIYFKGNWQHKFVKENTKKEPFWTSEDKSVDVDMMHIKEDFKYGSFDNLDATALELKYDNASISFLILLPNKRNGLKDLEAKLQDVNLADLTNNMYKSEVEVAIPKFRSEYEVELTEPLKELGFRKMFADADFGNLLTSPEPLVVSSVVHKAFIEVNEEGAEAAAATGFEFVSYSMAIPKEPKQFKVEHPFVYFIKTHDNVLFQGRHTE